MPDIKPLPAVAVHLLGAGQAIQDAPAVIKELIDNAVDAQASNISIEVSLNMLDLLQVRDNGHGVPPGDRHLLCQRHCTSKISSEHDLNNVGGSTLGFRGEALSSIAASSGFLSITTRTKEEPVSTVMTFDTKGNIISTTRASMAVGTVIKVADFLKHNPVRHKTASAKASAALQKVKQMLHAYVCAQPGIRLSFKVVKQDGKHDFLYVPAQHPSAMDAVTKLFGVRCALQCVAVDAQHGTVSMTAVLPKGNADSEHVSRLGCFISCDGRPMSAHKGTFKQIRHIFHDAVPFEHDVLLVLHIVCAPGMYDVNIEPSKDNVIFEDVTVILKAAQQLFASIYKRSEALSAVATPSIALPIPLLSSDTTADGSSVLNIDHSRARPVATITVQESSRVDTQDSVTSRLHSQLATPFSSQASGPAHSQRSGRNFKPRASQKAHVHRPFVPPSVRERQDRVWFDHLEPYEQARQVQSSSRGSRRRNDNLDDLLHDSQPISPPQRNTDIRSFCQPRPSDAHVGGSAHGPDHKQTSSQVKHTSARSPSLYSHFEDDGLSAEVFDEVLKGRIDSSIDIPLTPPTSSLPSSTVNALASIKYAQLKQPAPISMAPMPHREASSQFLAWVMLSSASKMTFQLETSVQAIAELAVTADICCTTPPIETAVAHYRMLWLEECTDEDVGSIAAVIERRLEPCDPRRSIILRLKESIKQAIASHLQCDASSGVASSDTDLLL